MYRRIQMVARAGAVPPLVALCRGPQQPVASQGEAPAAAPGKAPAPGRAAPANAVKKKWKTGLVVEVGRVAAQEQASGCLRSAPIGSG